MAKARDASGANEEAALVEAARRDPAAFSHLYRRYVEPIYRYLYKRVGSAADAEDLTAQVFSEALEGLFYYREQGKFTAWLFTIARRKAIAYYRQGQSQGGLQQLPLDEARDHPNPQGDLLEQVEHKQKMERIAALIAELDDEKQELLRLRFTAGLSYKEIGSLLGRSEAAVKMAVHRLLRHLQDRWEGER